MNSGQGPRQWADYHLPTKQGEEGGKTQQGDNIGGTYGANALQTPSEICLLKADFP